jgi:O-antigen/teichoic acid export membrane protein
MEAGEAEVAGADLKQRAVFGAFIVVVRGAGVRLIGTGGYLVLAGLLSPADFGIVAFGLAITFATKFFTDAGLATALIRRPVPPSHDEYRTVLGIQFIATLILALVAVAWWAVLPTKVSGVTALFLLGLPLIAFRIPSLVALERRLEFRPTAVGEVVEVGVYNVVAVGAVLLGAGPAGLGLAAMVKTAVGTCVINRLGPVGWLRPRISLRAAREVLPFGLKVSAGDAVGLGRDQGLNVVIAAVAGYSTLGLWTIANRLFTLPLLLFESLWRVSLPTMVQVRATRDDAGEVMLRGVSLGAVLGTLVLVPFAVAASPALALLVGDQWRQAGDVAPWFCLGMAISAPLSAAAIGYLYAEDAAGAVLVCTAGAAIVLLASSVVALLAIGYVGVGIGWAIGAVTVALLLSRSVRRRSGVNLMGPLRRPTLAGSLAVLIGVVATKSVPDDLTKAAIGTFVSVSGYLLLVTLLDRPGVRYATVTLAQLRRRHQASPP